jgi:amidase
VRDPDPPAVDPSPSTVGVGFQSIAETRQRLETGATTSVQLVESLLRRIGEADAAGPGLHVLVSLCRDALETAEALDQERARGKVRGLLHGIPALVKDNVDTTGDEGTTAGSLALTMTRPLADATVVRRMRAAGVIVIGKSNLSEWANFRGRHSSSGWSATGGQCLNPHALNRSPGGSSSGSGAGVAAGFAPVAVGTETDGSILCPAALNGVVGIKPTVGLTSRAGVVPISSSQDTVGPIARSVADAAALLGVLAAGRDGADARDGATMPRPGDLPDDYTRFCEPGGLSGTRIGVARQGCFGYSDRADELVEAALGIAARHGAVIVDPADVATVEEIARSDDEMTVLLHEFKAGVEAYLATRPPAPGQPRTLPDLVEFNEAHASAELGVFGQEILIAACSAGRLDNPAYLEARSRNWRRARDEGIDAVIEKANLDVLAVPTIGPAWCIDHVNGDSHTRAGYQVAAVAGYPAISLPVGKAQGLPVGICLFAKAWSEARLIRIAFGLEQALALGDELRPAWRTRIE